MGVGRYVTDLLLIDSVTPKEERNGETILLPITEIVRYVDTVLKRFGYKVAYVGKERVNAVIGAGNYNDLMFQGHIDVTPEGKGWTHDWLGRENPEENDGKIYARGATDMKSQVGTLFSVLEDSDKKPLVVLTTDEEDGHITNFKGARESVRYLTGSNIHPQFAINMESSKENFQIVTSRKGMYWAQLHVFGRAAHGSIPWEGDNAIYKGARIALLLEQHSREVQSIHHETLGIRTLNVGTFHAGTEPNTVPNYGLFNLESRHVPGEAVEEISGKIIRKLIEGGLKQSSGPEDFNGDFYLDTKVSNPGYSLDPKNPKLKELQRLMESMGFDSQLYTGTGFAENVFFHEVGIPIVTLGVRGNNEHAPDEFVEVEDLNTLKRIYTEIIKAF